MKPPISLEDFVNPPTAGSPLPSFLREILIEISQEPDANVTMTCTIVARPISLTDMNNYLEAK